ncbi:L-threonylcarbamoyladenylate synthase [Falsibacillus pallidus]|uniref:Threonylcarbamoyl-AMP synthase n=1 Tax=Falsibacillus pallidus TaxID=493781 RepID=A0A370GCP8_9BACI|nr:L-threonylcarbamoyladenylate synthase [Falsibacillus pallidus]RDI41568.1 translation factor SUA5 [Falsibacillus pallidus]
MKTIKWIVDKHVNEQKDYPHISQAAEFLNNNEVVAFPTETVYGLGANARSTEAVAKIFEAKGRPSDNPLIVHIGDRAQLPALVKQINEKAEKLIEAFWPGPLTIIFEKQDGVFSDKVTAGLDTVGIRLPDHPVAMALIKEADLPIAAPSANRSGRPSPTTAKHVLDDLEGKIAGIVDGGATGVGVESTVIDCTAETPVILRPGGVSKEEIESIIGPVEIDAVLLSGEGAPKSPGMKYTHYAPDAPLYLMEGSPEKIQTLVDDKQKEGLKVGVLATEESKGIYSANVVIPCGSRKDLPTVAQSLYDVLRAFNEADLDMIVSEVFPRDGIGTAIMNRLEKAAGHRWL